MHKHHIYPKHFFRKLEWLGLEFDINDPSNIKELSIEEHAAAHKELYEKYGYWEDDLAWKGLSKEIGQEEIILKKISRLGSIQSPETRAKIGAAIKGKKKPPGHGEHVGDAKAKVYLVKNIFSNEEKIIKNMTRWCKNNGLDRAAIYRTYWGIRTNHKGWKILKEVIGG